MGTYIVRIYRSDDTDPDMLAGIVEEPGIPEKKPFTSVNGLLNILRPRKKKPSKSNPARSETDGRADRDGRNPEDRRT